VAGNELGYMGLDKRGAERLFQVPTEREEKTAAAIASNDSFSAWTKTFTDPRLCAAIVDRLTFGGNIIETGTRVVDRSVRCQHAIDPTLRPQCTLTATLQVGTIALCSSCHSRRSSVGKGQPPSRCPPARHSACWSGSAPPSKPSTRPNGPCQRRSPELLRPVITQLACCRCSVECRP